jgi:DNA polymerase I-like protein with 3'-5' exonuclease and polymerase domains/uracil-DNA glycosylase
MDEVLPHHRAAVARGAKCLSCPLYDCGQGPVMGVVRPGSLLTVVGEAPGTSEVEEGKPFVGASGEVLNEALAQGGVDRAACTITNAILCRPPGGNMLDYLGELKRKWQKDAARAKAEKREAPDFVVPQDCCAPRLAQDVAEAGAKVVLALGGEALKAMAHQMRLPFAGAKAAPGQPRVATIKKQHGSPVFAPDGRILTSALHPAFALHGSSTFMPIIRADIQRAARIALRGGVVDWSEPTFIIKPSADTCVNVLDRLRASGAQVTVDIETNSANVQTADIRCVGLGAVVEGQEVIIVVPLKHMNGAPWWRPGDEQRVRVALTAVLEHNPLAGHNLLFDTAVLLQHRLLLNRGKRWFDTMIAHHDTSHSELPHDLGFVAARYFEAPRWKDDADSKTVDGVDDYWLHLYCAKDVLGELRLVNPLLEQVDREGTVGALSTDLKLAPIARDMGMLGLHIDEATRLKFFHTLDKAGAERAAEVRRLTGIPDFNPNAFKQVSRYLYVTKGLSPPYATDGREWEELAEDDETPLDTDDPEVILAKATTNEQALLRLLELGVDDQTAQFVEMLLSYRGIQKCKSTYVGLKLDDEGKLVDTHRARGFMQTEAWDGLTNLSILHPSWKLHVTPTGRWATSPNVQNWPERVVYNTDLYKATGGKDGIINTRAMVTAPPGYVLVGADYAAIELRMYAIMAQDKLLIDAINTGKDPHSLNYATMMARHPGDIDKWYERVKNSDPKVKKYLRNVAKRLAFLIVYGGQKDKLYKTMSADRNPDGTRSFPDLKPGDVEMWFDNWHRGHPETRRWHEAVVRAWSSHGFVATILDGRRRFFIGGLDPTAMPNMTIQGSAASIANRAMLAIAAACPHRGWGGLAGPILQVHDFIGLQVPLARQKEAEDLLNTAMPYEHAGMRFDVEMKSGPSWDKT